MGEASTPLRCGIVWRGVSCGIERHHTGMPTGAHRPDVLRKEQLGQTVAAYEREITFSTRGVTCLFAEDVLHRPSDFEGKASAVNTRKACLYEASFY